MKYAIIVGKQLMAILYGILKLFPVKKNKVTFISRQSNSLTTDFKLLQKELVWMNPKIKIVCICNRMETIHSGILKFTVATLRSMFHLSTSSVCVLDAYWPAVSMLKHKNDLTVIQMWHSLGKVKQSGLATVGKESGRSQEIARIMSMHKNYDYVVAGGSAWNKFYCDSFGIQESKILNIGLPRIDYLIQTEKQNSEKILKAYPEMRQKKVILYAPTFRKNIELNWEQILEYIDSTKCIFIVKGHPNQRIVSASEGVLQCSEFSSLELLSVSDYLITDYSAISIEAAVLNVKTLYYVYDYDEYMKKNGLNIDLYKEMPGCVFKDAESLMEIINNDNYNSEALNIYRKKYLPKELGNSSEKLAKVILDNMK